MVKVKRCSYGTCSNDSRYLDPLSGIFFVPFPKPKRNYAKCKQWVERCGRLDDFNISKITYNTFVCSLHFEGGQGPTERNPDIVDFTKTPIYKALKEQDEYYQHLEESYKSKLSFVPHSVEHGEVNDPGCQNYVATVKKECELVPEENSMSIYMNHSEISDPGCQHHEIMVKKECILVPDEDSSSTDTNHSEVIDPEFQHYGVMVKQECVFVPEENSMTIDNFCPDQTDKEPNDTIENILAAVSVIPNGWAVVHNSIKNEVSFFKYSSTNSTILISITLSLTLDYAEERKRIALKVLNYDIPPNHRAYLELEDKLPTLENLTVYDISHALTSMDNFTVCHGIREEKFRNQFENGKKNNGFFCWFDNAIHSSNCDYLTNIETCKNCKNLQAALRKQISRKKTASVMKGLLNQKYNKRSAIGSLPRLELVHLIKKQQKREYYLKSRIFKLKRNIQQRGQSLDDDDEDSAILFHAYQ